MSKARVIPPTIARRLAITRQRLAGPRLPPSADGIVSIVRDIGCIQIDPISVVAPSSLLVLWSRLGNYDQALLDKVLWDERRLFEDFAQATSIVLTEDYPIFSTFKRNYAKGDSPWARRVREWMMTNRVLRSHIIAELRHRGPLFSRDLEDKAVKEWRSSGWTSGRNVDMMLVFLAAQGKVMVAKRSGGQKQYGLTENLLPDWVPREHLSWHETVKRSSQKSLRALGVAPKSHIERHYIRGSYPGLTGVLAELESEGRIERVQISDSHHDRPWPGTWFIHADDIPLLDKLVAGEWQPRTTLLSPFDNLISDRRRTEQVFDFKFSLEIYVPKPKRRYGYYVMPILHGDRLIGRVDLAMDKEQERLMVRAVYAEQDAPITPETGRAVAGAIEELATFLGAHETIYGRRVPEGWKSALH